MTTGDLIGLDIGTGGAKGLLLSPEGQVKARAFEGYPLHTPRPGWVEQRPEDWWEAAAAVLQALTREAGREKIRAIGLAGQMHGSVFLDACGQPIRPALLWNDARTGEECGEIERRIGRQRLQAITGNPALAGWQAPKILWLRNHETAQYARVAKVLLPKDYVRYRLTGTLCTDASDASGTLLMDLRQRNWSDVILHELEVPQEWLPSIFEGTEPTGGVTADAALQTGMTKGTPVIAGGGDNAASAVGVGAVSAQVGMLSMGTSGVILVHCDGMKVDPAGAIHACCHALPARYHLMGVVLAAGDSLRWYRDALGAETVAAARRLGRDPYDVLIAETQDVHPGADGLFFLPYLAGERTPHMNPDARGAWIGLSLAHGRAHLVRAILEGVAFALKDTLVRIETLGARPQELRIVGGGARSSVWRGILASVLDIPLRRTRTDDGASLGAALLAGVGCGAFSDIEEAVSQAVRPMEEVESPDRDLSAVYQDLYASYRLLYPALAETGMFGSASRAA